MLTISGEPANSPPSRRPSLPWRSAACEGHTWNGHATVLIFGWKNNMGTVTTQTLGGANWMQCTLPSGMIFGAGCQKSMANGAAFQIPAAAGDGSTLQAIVGSSLGTPVAGANHEAQGVGSCYLDASNVVHITFDDNGGDTWGGQADVFAIFATPSAGLPTVVQVLPQSASVAAGGLISFAATISGNANQSVTWSVDGVAGGNASVGTIDANGNYQAPGAAGAHTVTATSVAVPASAGSATVMVTGGGAAGWTINGS